MPHDDPLGKGEFSSNQPHFVLEKLPQTLWWVFMVAEGPLNETLSITSG
jgi:hypothetical protein